MRTNSTDSFMERLSKNFPNDSDSAKADDIKNFINQLSGEQQERLWQKFIESYEYNSMPRVAYFIKLFGNEPRGGIKEELFCYCKTCKISMPVDIRVCVICGGNLIINKKQLRHIGCHQECPTCEKFVIDQTTGAECQYWGVGVHESGLQGEEFGALKAVCTNCECQACCRAERLFRTDYDLYREQLESGLFDGGYKYKGGQ